jgi:hypothetical protein
LYLFIKFALCFIFFIELNCWLIESVSLMAEVSFSSLRLRLNHNRIFICLFLNQIKWISLSFSFFAFQRFRFIIFWCFAYSSVVKCVFSCWSIVQSFCGLHLFNILDCMSFYSLRQYTSISWFLILNKLRSLLILLEFNSSMLFE